MPLSAVTKLLYFIQPCSKPLNHRGQNSVICVTTTNMKSMRKLAILESLDAMDHIQMEKVLLYIKEMLQQGHVKNERKFRQQAMEQIRMALRSEKDVNVKV